MVNTDKLSELMAKQKMDARELSAKIGVSEAMVSYIKRGLKQPSVEVLVRIANALGCKVDDLVTAPR